MGKRKKGRNWSAGTRSIGNTLKLETVCDRIQSEIWPNLIQKINNSKTFFEYFIFTGVWNCKSRIRSESRIPDLQFCLLNT